MTRELTTDEIRRRQQSGDWLYDAELGAWIDRRDNEAYTLYLQMQANAGAVRRAERDIWASEIEPLIEQAAALEGVTPAWYLERLTQRRSAMKQATAEFDERVAAARAARHETKAAPLVFSVKSTSDGKTGVLKGYLAVFGNVDLTGDVIQSGAFSKTLAEHRAKPYSDQGLLPLCLHHDLSRPVGVFTELEPNSKGLLFTARINADTRDGAEALSNVRAGVLSGMSIGYAAMKVGWDASGNRLLQELRLNEGSLVTLPANPEAKILTVY